jgi:AraC-like DNA-binding protein
MLALAVVLAGIGMVVNGRFAASFGQSPDDLGHARGARGLSPSAAGCGRRVLFVTHFARSPRLQAGGTDPRGLARVVARARVFIHENLDGPLSIDKIANAARTSHRTLHRAFQIVLDETPYSYVLKLRLHRIRHELVSDAEIACTITCAANRWGISELGRFAGWYRDLFGELPSETLARQRRNTTPLVNSSLAGFA